MAERENQMASSKQKDASLSDAPTSSTEGKQASRRRLIKGIAAAPLVMTLASRPALSRNFCSISGWGSVHPSGRPEGYAYCEGRSPGFWKTYWSSSTSAAWALTGFNPGPTNPITGDSHDYSIPTLVELGTLTTIEQSAYITGIQAASTFDQLMGTGTLLPDNPAGLPITRPTIMQIFHDKFYKQSLPNNAAFHYCASLLNAAAWGEGGYGYSLSQMRALIGNRDGTAGFIDDLKGLYDR